MDVKRYFRGPVFWIALVVLAVLLVSQLVTSTGGLEKVDTSDVVEAIEAGNVEVGDAHRPRAARRAHAQERRQDRGRLPVRHRAPTSSAEPAARRRRPRGYDVDVPQQNWFCQPAAHLLPIVLIVVIFLFFMNQMQGGGSRVMNFGKSKAKLITKDTPKTTFADVAGADEAVEELAGDQGVPPGPGEVPGRRRQDPQGRAAVRPARHRQDAARPRRRRRGRRAVLLDLRLRLRRDVRRCRRLPGPRPVRAGQGQRPGDRLRRRDRRRRPAPRRRPRRRARRARADPQPAARRDGRLRRQGRRHPDRRHQPARHPRPGAAAPRPLRPADRRRAPRPAGPQQDPPGARQGQADRRRTSTCWPSPGARPASPAPTWPTCSTRPRCSPPAATRSSSTTPRWTRRSTASSPARRSAPGS